jgi:hypothetical protein
MGTHNDQIISQIQATYGTDAISLHTLPKQQRVDIATELRQFLKAFSPQKLSRVSKEGETWVFLEESCTPKLRDISDLLPINIMQMVNIIMHVAFMKVMVFPRMVPKLRDISNLLPINKMPKANPFTVFVFVMAMVFPRMVPKLRDISNLLSINKMQKANPFTVFVFVMAMVFPRMVPKLCDISNLQRKRVYSGLRLLLVFAHSLGSDAVSIWWKRRSSSRWLLDRVIRSDNSVMGWRYLSMRSRPLIFVKCRDKSSLRQIKALHSVRSITLSFC